MGHTLPKIQITDACHRGGVARILQFCDKPLVKLRWKFVTAHPRHRDRISKRAFRVSHCLVACARGVNAFSDSFFRDSSFIYMNKAT